VEKLVAFLQQNPAALRISFKLLTRAYPQMTQQLFRSSDIQLQAQACVPITQGVNQAHSVMTQPATHTDSLHRAIQAFQGLTALYFNVTREIKPFFSFAPRLRNIRPD
jgi:hypothetical protein